MIRKLLDSFRHAFAGLRYCIVRERNFRIHICVATAVLAFAVLYGALRWEYAVIFLAIGLVMAMELLNTAIERTVDLITKEKRPQAKAAKDSAAGMVLISAAMALALAGAVFSDPERWEILWNKVGNHLWLYLGGFAAWACLAWIFVFYFPFGKRGRSKTDVDINL